MTEFLAPTDQRLNLKSDPITPDAIKQKVVRNLIERMKIIATGERDEENPQRKTMVGLAAPQIGRRLRMILIDMAADSGVPNFEPDLQVFINPRIVDSSPHMIRGREGCYSTGTICGAVYRAKEVTVEALNEDGESLSFTSTNPFQARILQHEVDHLDGMRFPDRIPLYSTPQFLHEVADDEFQDYRENWQRWKKSYPIQDWLRIRRGEDPSTDRV